MISLSQGKRHLQLAYPVLKDHIIVCPMFQSVDHFETNNTFLACFLKSLLHHFIALEFQVFKIAGEPFEIRNSNCAQNCIVEVGVATILGSSLPRDWHPM